MIKALPITGNPYFAMDHAEGKEADKERSQAVKPHKTRQAKTSPINLALKTPASPSPRPATNAMLRAAIEKSRSADAQEKLGAFLLAGSCVNIRTLRDS